MHDEYEYEYALCKWYANEQTDTSLTHDSTKISHQRRMYSPNSIRRT